MFINISYNALYTIMPLCYAILNKIVFVDYWSNSALNLSRQYNFYTIKVVSVVRSLLSFVSIILVN